MYQLYHIANRLAKKEGMLRYIEDEADEPKVTYDTGAQRSALEERFDLIPGEALIREAARWGMGAVKYGDYNWQKGFPAGVVENHLLRHAILYCMGDRTDDHLAAIRCNAGMLMHYEKHGNPAVRGDSGNFTIKPYQQCGKCQHVFKENEPRVMRKRTAYGRDWEQVFHVACYQQVVDEEATV